ncbi:hypothetical protein JQ633_29270 [Bradyrhizobium tropiciagri]|uniref:hypothetical protein n=1 Tax=Bradyrhizobium tropiciagri TaxID=312253 RepID=UPI001BAAE06D|nr:hypothetical protein [Bradyrhizobium tropiciagri]MBR0874479.1 hypothetical protein [Bradyrhizobium tropiciagri]
MEAKKRRRRVVQTDSLEARLLERAEQLRGQAAALLPDLEKEALLKFARQAETGAGVSEWLRPT